MVSVDRIDHLVLTVRDLDRTIRFYTEVLGMDLVVFGKGRKALSFGRQKLNLHVAGAEFEPKAHSPTPGSADLCLIVTGTTEELVADLEDKGVRIELGPVTRTGALGAIESVYLRDPDGNLLELSVYASVPRAH